MLIVAIFHFIFGGYGLLCGLIGIAGLAAGGANMFTAAPPGGGAASRRKFRSFRFGSSGAEQEAPLQKVFAPVRVTLDLLLSVLLIVAGLGLVQMKPFGWWGSVVYGVLSILIQISFLLFTLLYSLPIGQRILEQELQNRPTLHRWRRSCRRCSLSPSVWRSWV